jgi:hypothetical protein
MEFKHETEASEPQWITADRPCGDIGDRFGAGKGARAMSTSVSAPCPRLGCNRTSGGYARIDANDPTGTSRALAKRSEASKCSCDRTSCLGNDSDLSGLVSLGVATAISPWHSRLNTISRARPAAPFWRHLGQARTSPKWPPKLYRTWVRGSCGGRDWAMAGAKRPPRRRG